jgi:hypothetical protein
MRFVLGQVGTGLAGVVSRVVVVIVKMPPSCEWNFAGRDIA